MIFAALGNFSGPACTLRATLDAISDEGIYVIVQTGQLFAGCDAPNELPDLLREHEVRAAQGNDERLLLRWQQKQAQLRKRLDDAAFARIESAHARLSSATLECLRGLRKQIALTMDGLDIVVCLGAPGNPRVLITPETPDDHLRRYREISVPDIVVCGGHPEPFHRLVDGTLFVCPGTVAAADGTVGYALISTEQEPWSAEQVTIPMD